MCIRSSFPEGDSRTGFPSAGCRPAVRSVQSARSAATASHRYSKQGLLAVQKYRHQAEHLPRQRLPLACCAFSATICATPVTWFYQTKNRRQAEHPPRQRLPLACCATAQRYAQKASQGKIRSDIAQPGGFCRGAARGVYSRTRPERRRPQGTLRQSKIAPCTTARRRRPPSAIITYKSCSCGSRGPSAGCRTCRF